MKICNKCKKTKVRNSLDNYTFEGSRYEVLCNNCYMDYLKEGVDNMGFAKLKEDREYEQRIENKYQTLLTSYNKLQSKFDLLKDNRKLLISYESLKKAYKELEAEAVSIREQLASSNDKLNLIDSEDSIDFDWAENE